MAEELRFNICGLSSSFIRNVDVEDLRNSIATDIPPHLNLACCTWTYHITQIRALEPALVQMISNFFRFHLLFWLEVMSLTKRSAEKALAQLNTVKVHRKSCFRVHRTYLL